MSPDIMHLISIWAVPLIIAITFHEAAHAYVASILGDDTARSQGRVTLNPFSHIDPMGTLILPGLLLSSGAPFVFGWAKPVPVNFLRLGRPRRDMVLVAAAGPAMNIILAIICAFLLANIQLFPEQYMKFLGQNFKNAIVINIILAVFNMMPVPPLDGGRIAVGVLPRFLGSQLAKLERYGFFIIIGLLLLPSIGRAVGEDWSVMSVIIGVPFEWILNKIALLTGLA